MMTHICNSSTGRRCEQRDRSDPSMSSKFSEKFCFKTYNDKVLRETPGLNLWPPHGHTTMYTQKDTLSFITRTIGKKTMWKRSCNVLPL